MSRGRGRLPPCGRRPAARADAARRGEDMPDRVRVLVVGVGNMGLSHARAYDALEGFEIAGLVSRGILGRADLPEPLARLPRFADFDEALAATRPHAVSINTWPDTPP